MYPVPTRKLVAILFADIVGYTALMQVSEQQALNALQKFKVQLETQVPIEKGEIIQFYGDGCLCTFDSSVNAVNCAKKLQLAFKNAPEVPVRIGLHAGEVVFKEDNAFGDAVNIASRIESMGVPGSVLISSNIRNQIKNKPEFELVSLGRFEFKNVLEGMTVYALKNEGLIIPEKEEIKGKLKAPPQKKTFKYLPIIITALLIVLGIFFFYKKNWRPAQTDTSSIKKSIAVLPFRNDSPDNNNIYFCNGIMDGVLNHLAKIPELTVVSRSDVEKYRASSLSSNEIASELGVNYIVEGSVQKIGEQVLIYAQLSKLQEEGYLWSEKFDKKLEDIFSIQSDVTQSIAESLQTLLSPELKKRIEAVPTKDQIAYDYYLQGNEYLFKTNIFSGSDEEWKSSLEKATLFYQKALERDSLLAEAYVNLARIELLTKRFNSIFEENYLDTIHYLANKAISINPNLAEGYIALGFYYLYTGKESLAKYEFDKALKLNPNDLTILINQFYLTLHNKFNYFRCVEIIKKIESKVVTEEDQESLNQVYYGFYRMIGDLKLERYYSKKINSLPDFWYYIKVNELDNALISLDELHKIDNQHKLNYLGLIHLQKREFEQAVKYFIKWEQLVKTESPNNWESANNWHRYGQALMKNGQEDEGKIIIEKQIDNFKKQIALKRMDGVGVFYDLAGSYAFLGDKENAYYWLEKFIREEGWLKQGDLETFILYDISFDNLRNDQRFKNIVEEGKLEKARIRNEVKAYMKQLELLD